MSVFSDDWRDCLREQYQYVVRQQDRVTERSLLVVLHQVGFSDDELRQLKLAATMRADDLPDDFVPDMDLLAEQSASELVAAAEAPRDFQPHPAECQCPSCVNLNLTPHDEDGQPLDMDPEELADRAQFAAENEDDSDDVEQLSLF